MSEDIDGWMAELSASKEFYEHPNLSELLCREVTQEEKIQNNRQFHLIGEIKSVPFDAWGESHYDVGTDRDVVVLSTRIGKRLVEVHVEYTALYVDGVYVSLNQLESWRLEWHMVDVVDDLRSRGIKPIPCVHMEDA